MIMAIFEMCILIVFQKKERIFQKVQKEYVVLVIIQKYNLTKNIK